MKSAVVYYSFTGNTHRVAYAIIDLLKSRSEEAIAIRIRPLKEETGFFGQCKGALLSRKPELYRTLFDLKDFDRIILGSPVWAFKPAPAINTYLDKCGSLEGKEAFAFVTYGSGAGRTRALEIMASRLRDKGAHVTGTMSFRQGEDAKACKEKIQKVL